MLRSMSDHCRPPTRFVDRLSYVLSNYGPAMQKQACAESAEHKWKPEGTAIESCALITMRGNERMRSILQTTDHHRRRTSSASSSKSSKNHCDHCGMFCYAACCRFVADSTPMTFHRSTTQLSSGFTS